MFAGQLKLYYSLLLGYSLFNMSIADVEGGFEIPGFVVIDKEAVARTEEILRLGRLVLKDPRSLVVVRAPNRNEVSVPHRKENDTQLTVREDMAFSDAQGGHILEYTQLGVKTSDGEISLTIKQCRLNYYNLNDPFSDMLVDYFASHAEAMLQEVPRLRRS